MKFTEEEKRLFNNVCRSQRSKSLVRKFSEWTEAELDDWFDASAAREDPDYVPDYPEMWRKSALEDKEPWATHVYNQYHHYPLGNIGRGHYSWKEFDRDMPEGTDAWDEPLINLAYEGTYANEGDFVSRNNGKNWAEVVRIFKWKHSYIDERDEEQDYYKIQYCLQPVDQYGNTLTKEEIYEQCNSEDLPYYKMHLDGDDRWAYEWEVNVRDSTDKRHFNDMLVVSTNQVGEGNWHTTPRTIDKGGHPFKFPALDEWGRVLPSDEYLKEHPNFDIDTDFLSPRDYKAGKVLPSAGNQEVRDNFRKARADLMDSRRASEETMKKVAKEAYDDWKAALSKIDDDDIVEKILNEKDIFIKDPHLHFHKSEFASLKDFKKWLKEVGGDDLVKAFSKLAVKHKVDDHMFYWWNNHYDETDDDWENKFFQPQDRKYDDRNKQ